MLRPEMVKHLLIAFVLVACGGSSKPTAPAAPALVLVNVDSEGVILGGLDAMAYRDGAPTEGIAEHTSQHAGAIYRFASAQHKVAFEADRARNAPGYGGYCAFAASQNRLQVADPKAFEIYEGQLLVFTNEAYRDQFDKDRAGAKAKADANWPGLVAKHGKPPR
jgi:hypothetical protein